MNNSKEKAIELCQKFGTTTMRTNCNDGYTLPLEIAKKCALIAVENEYKSLREQLFNLRVCRVIENENTYLTRLQLLIDEESELKSEIEKI